METAIHSGADAIFTSHKKLQERPQIKQSTQQQERLARLSNSDDFKALVKVIDGYIDKLKIAPALSKDDTVEAIGYRYLASSLAIEFLEEIKSYPERQAKLISKKNND